jgi:primosomal protein DnaI
MTKTIEIIKADIMEDLAIREFCLLEHVTDEEFVRNFHKLYVQKNNNGICKNCSGKKCDMDPYGMQSRLVYRNKIDIEYFECPKTEHYVSSNIKMLYYPDHPDFEGKTMDFSKERALAFKAMTSFKNSYEKGRFTKGIYFHGPFGTGKSFLMYNLAKDMIKKKATVTMAYYPDLVRIIKSSIGNNDMEKTINDLKYTDILMLDDIGAENNTPFIRDEVLGPILQFRLESNLPVCFTSNLSLPLLKEHFMESKDEIDQIKSDRILERIRFLTNQVEVHGENYRNRNENSDTGNFLAK